MEPSAVASPSVVFRCPGCALLWCEAGAVARITGWPDDLLDPVPEAPPSVDVLPDATPCPRCDGVCLERVPFARIRGPWIDRCPYCAGLLLDPQLLPAMREAAARRRAPPPPPPAPVAEPLRVDFDSTPWSPLTLRQSLLAVPVTLAVCAALRPVSFPGVFLFGVRVSLHELGHAMTAWACSWRALPLPVGFTLTFPGRSWVVFFGLTAADVALVLLGIARRAWFLVALPAVLFATLCVGTFGLDAHTQDRSVTFGGCGGELVLGALLVVSFHHRMPDRVRWDFFRWAALALGAWVLVDASVFWHQCAADWSRIPWGGAFGEDGDMTKLRDQHHWDEARITSTYVALSRWCLGVVAAWWAAHVALALRRSISAARTDTTRDPRAGAARATGTRR